MAKLVDSYSESNYSSDWNLFGASEGKAGQSFTGDGGILDSCKFYLKKTGSPTGNIYVEIYAHTGTFGNGGKPTGSALATSDVVDVSTLSSSSALRTFTFTSANKITLTNDTKYVAVIVYQGGDASNKVGVGQDTSSPTHSGNMSYWVSPTWYADEDYYDLCFYVYKDDLIYLGTYTDTTDTDTYTFASKSLGTAVTGRYIIVSAVSRKAGAGFTLSSITIGGVTATITRQVTNTITNSNCAALVIASVPTGATGDIVVTWSTTVLRCAIGVWRAVDIAGVTAYDVDSSTASDPTVNLDVPIGFAVGAGLSAASTTASWTGLTEKFDATLETFVTYTGASDSFDAAASSREIKIDFASSTETIGVFASWEYSPGKVIKDVIGSGYILSPR